MLIVTHRHVFISQQVNDPRHSRSRRRCGRPAMQQSVGTDERNSSDFLEDRNAGAQLNDSFQFNRATMVTSEHKSTTEGANFDKQSMSRDIVQDKCESREKSISRHRYKSTSRSVRRRGKIIDSSSKSMGVPKRYILGDQTWEPLHLPMLL